MIRTRRILLFAALGVSSSACAPSEEDVTLQIRRILPDAARALSLNESIVVQFDRAIDPLSVTRDSIRLIDERGRPVEPERIKVRESTIEFVPRVPILPSLEDGTYSPGSQLRLEIATYPRPGGLRSDRGELLIQAPARRWNVVDVSSRTSEGRLVFLPSSDIGPFRLVEAPRVSSDGRRILLRFDRPVYPPSIDARALRLVTDMISNTSIPIRVTPGGDGASRGKVVEIVASRPLPAAGALLFFRPGQIGLLDYRLTPLSVPRDPTAFHYPELGRSLRVRPDSSRPMPDGVFEKFEKPRRDRVESIASLSLPFECEGRLRWGDGGLWFPRLDWARFQSLGVLHPPPGTRDLRAGAEREIAAGVTRTLPDGPVWDFDRVVVPAGQRVYVVLPKTGALAWRIAGSMRIDGELILRVAAGGSHPTAGPASADPRPRWDAVDGRIEIEVAGHVRGDGAIRVEPAGVGLAGWLRVRSPLQMPTDRLALQLWEAADDVRPRLNQGPALPGRWCAVSPWYEFGDSRSFLGRFEAAGAEPGLDVYVQCRQALPGAESRPWQRVEAMSRLGELEALRFVVAARGLGDGARVLRSLRLR